MFKKLIVLWLVIGLVGCASSMEGDTYTRGQVRQVENVQMATVQSVRNVKIEGTKSAIGAGAGTIIGGVAGANSNHGSAGSVIASVVGAVVGGMAGAGIEEGITRQAGLEITIKYDDGKMVAVVQGDNEKFKVGDRVRVIYGSGVTRITHE
jgi:outer membrane lipoprotein SlyB